MPPITPQLAWRVAVLGAVAFVLFATVFFRLWSLQVLSGSRFVALARDNGRRELPIEAPRGDIVDRDNAKLVTTRRAAVVQIVPASLPKAERQLGDDYHAALSVAERARLDAETRSTAFERQLRDDGRRATRAERVEARRLRKAASAATPVPIPAPDRRRHALPPHRSRAADPPRDRPRAGDPRAGRGALREHHDPHRRPARGVRLHARAARAVPGGGDHRHFIRDYPHGALAAQLFGTVSQSTRKGTSGLEQHYDDVLRGVDGESRVTVDANGHLDEQAGARVTQPKQGERLQLTLDLGLQKAGDAALARAMAASKNPTRAGAWLAMDPRDGAIYGMGSSPSFDAGVLAKPFSEQTYRELTSRATDAPLVNRATESAYPTGSTFKPVTAFAALSGGLIDADTTIDDTGSWDLGTQHYQNAGQASFGTINVADALKVSSDIFFFQLGAQAPTTTT